MFREDNKYEDGEKFDTYWSPPGSYTLLYQQLALDIPSEYLGSNSVTNLKPYTKKYQFLNGIYET